MQFLAKFLGGWKLYAIAGTAIAAVSFYAGQRWEKGALIASLEAQLAVNAQAYEERLVEQNLRWQTKVAAFETDLLKWQVQAVKDEQTIEELIKAQEVLRRQFNELDTEITVVSDFGTCSFSDDAVRLLRSAGQTTSSRSTGLSGN